MILHLGVIEVPYTSEPSAPKRVRKAKQGKQRPRRTKKAAPALTTGDVATILEDKYHVMETFYNHHEAEIGEEIASSLEGEIENLMLGAPRSPEPLAEACQFIEEKFRIALDTKEFDSYGIDGVPTKASLDGVSHRFKTKHGPARPSFVDTSAYENSFKAWVTE